MCWHTSAKNTDFLNKAHKTPKIPPPSHGLLLALPLSRGNRHAKLHLPLQGGGDAGGDTVAAACSGKRRGVERLGEEACRGGRGGPWWVGEEDAGGGGG